MIDGPDFLRNLLRDLWPWGGGETTPSTSTRRMQMHETSSVAVQTTSEPTNKLAAGTTAAASVGAVIAGALAAYGNDAIRDVITEVFPAMAAKSATTNFVVFMLVTVAAYGANKWSGLKAGYNVLDKPNVPLALAPRPVAVVPSVQTYPTTPTAPNQPGD